MTRRRHWNGPAMRMFRWWNRPGDTGVSPALLGLPGNADGPPAALERPGDRGGLHGGFGVTCLQKNGCCMAGNCRWAEAGTGTYGPRYHTQTSRANRVVENNRAVMRKPRCCAQTALPRESAPPRANRTATHKPHCRAQTVSLRANRAAAGIYLCGCAPEPVAARRGGSRRSMRTIALPRANRAVARKPRRREQSPRREKLPCRAQIALLRTNRTAEYIARLGFNRAAGTSVASGRSPARGA